MAELFFFGGGLEILLLLLGTLVVGLMLYAWVAYRAARRGDAHRVLAQVAGKRLRLRQGPQGFSADYYVSFLVEGGERLEFQVPLRDYGMLAEKDKGELTFQGLHYMSFQKQPSAG